MKYTHKLLEGGAPQDYGLAIGAVIPEPSTVGFLILGVFSLVARRRR